MRHSISKVPHLPLLIVENSTEVNQIIECPQATVPPKWGLSPKINT